MDGKIEDTEQSIKRRAPKYRILGGRGSVAIGSSPGSGGSLLRAAKSGNTERLISLLDEEKIDINTCNSSGLNCIHLAAKEGHIQIVKELIQRNIPINQPTKRGNTALHIASLAGKLDVIKVLIENKAEPNSIAQNAFTPLYMAAQEGHEEIVDYLLKHGANQSISTEDGFTPLAVALQEGKDKVVALLLDNDVKGQVKLPALHIAARKDDVKAAALLLQNDHSADVTSKLIVNRTTESGFTALHIAAHYGNVSVASLLLNRGAILDYTAKNGITPLHVACKRGHTRFCALLLDRDANKDARTKDGLAPMHCAARSGHKPVVQLLLDRLKATEVQRTKNGLSALHMATQGGHVEVVKLLLENHYPVDDTTLDYLTSLHIAAHCGHEKVAKVLLSHKAKVDSQAMNGFTSLHVACKKNQLKIVILLLKHGANTEAVTESGLTPLHVACFMGHFEIVKVLLEKGAKLDTVNNRGETALHMATRSGQETTVKYLLDHGAHPDTRKKESQTALHLAARLNKLAIANILLKHGAVVDEVMRDGYTPLHVASKEGHVEICELLIDKGASVSLATKKGFTPLHLAAKYGRISVVNLLLKKYASSDAAGKDGLTPLHIAAHYDNSNVALLLLKNGASPLAPAKNGYTPLHIAAKKNQIDIAVTLLEYGATSKCKTRMGATPLHLAVQAGHTDMCSLLLAKDAVVNETAKHGITPMHLAAEEDNVAVAKVLYDNRSLVDPLTKKGYTPLHIACHHGNVRMVEYLVSLGAKVNAKTKNGYTGLHLAAQQGHTQIVDILLKFGASPNELTNDGNTALSLAKRLGYITCVDTLTTVTTEITETTSEEKHKLNVPETFREGFMSDASDDEEDGMASEGGYLTGKELQELGDDSVILSSDAGMMMAGRNIRISKLDNTAFDKRASWNSSISESDNISARDRKMSGFLVSFVVDARGGTMRGSRHPDLRVVVPPNSCGAPTRITCRLSRRHQLNRSSANAMSGGLPLYEDEGKSARVLELGGKGTSFLDKLHTPSKLPHFNEGEFLSSRVLQIGPKKCKFHGPVAIEIPHFANLCGGEREIVIFRSDDGETWNKHRQACSDQEFLRQFKGIDIETSDELAERRVVRILTSDLPRYFALYSRTREEACHVGPDGGILESTIMKNTSATFPKDALTKEIKVGIQVRRISLDLCKRAVGTRAKASPIITVEPRRRKFHCSITLSIPLPEGGDMKDYLSTSEDSKLRLLCSISGDKDPAQWEDITGSTPLNFHEEYVSFPTSVSAKFWLIDCSPNADSIALAERIYSEAMHVPYLAKFVVLAKTTDPAEAKLRVFCLTDDKYERTLESQEHFVEVARSRDVDVLNQSSVYAECSGNLMIGKQTQPMCTFVPFNENRLHFPVKVRDMTQEPCGRLTFYRDARGAKVYGARKPLCSLNITLPQYVKTTMVNGKSTDINSQLTVIQAKERYYLVDPSSEISSDNRELRLHAVSSQLGLQWIELARELEVPEEEVWEIEKQCHGDVPGQRSFCMLLLWHERNKTEKNLDEKLRASLEKIGRQDLADKLDAEKTYNPLDTSVQLDNQMQYDTSGFGALSHEIGSPPSAALQHVSSPYPFKNESQQATPVAAPRTSKINSEKDAPLYSVRSDDEDDPNKPHFVYVDDGVMSPIKHEQDADEVFQTEKNTEKPSSSDEEQQPTETEDNLELQKAIEEKLKQVREGNDLQDEAIEKDVIKENNVSVESHTNAKENGTTEMSETTVTRTMIVETDNADDVEIPAAVVTLSGTEENDIEVRRQVTKQILPDSDSGRSTSDEE